jgi:hypothetical protein
MEGVGQAFGGVSRLEFLEQVEGVRTGVERLGQSISKKV